MGFIGRLPPGEVFAPAEIDVPLILGASFDLINVDNPASPTNATSGRLTLECLDMKRVGLGDTMVYDFTEFRDAVSETE